MSPRHAAEGGFTLLEVMVGLILLGLVLLGLAQGTAFGLSAWETQARIIGEHRDLDAIERPLRHLVERMDPGTRGRAPFLRATHDSLRFTTVLPSGLNAGALVDVWLAVDAAHRLMLRWGPHLHGVPLRLPPPVDTVLLEGVDRLDIRYWAAKDRGGSGVADWTGADLPDLIRIRVVTADGSPGKWPPILVSPMQEPPEE